MKTLKQGNKVQVKLKLVKIFMFRLMCHGLGITDLFCEEV